MPFRYRLIDADGADLGPFVSKRQDWKPGERIGRSRGEDMLITAVIEAEDNAGFRAYLAVVAVSSSDDTAGRGKTRPGRQTWRNTIWRF